MANVIDELVVMLKLDTSTLPASEQKTIAGLRKTAEEAGKQGKNIENSGKQAAQFFAGLRSEAIRATVAFLGFRGAVAFAGDEMAKVAGTGRTAKIIGETTKEVSLWGAAVKSLGGDASAAASSMLNLTQGFQQWALTGQSDLPGIFRAIGVAITDVDTGKLRNIRDIYLDLADRFSKMSAGEATFMGQKLGLDQGTINLLMKGRQGVEQLLGSMELLGVATDADAEKLQRLQTATEGFGTAAANAGRKVLTFLSNPLSDLLDKLSIAISNPGFVIGLIGPVLGAKWYEFQKWIEQEKKDAGKTPQERFASPSSSTGAPKSNSVFDLFQKLENSKSWQVSPKGAIGRNQIMPDTARQYGFDPSRLNEPAYNDQVARAIQDDLARRFNGDVESMAIGYNAGPGWVPKWEASGRNDKILPSETQKYLARTREYTGGTGSKVTNIGTIVINSQATDAAGIARDLRGELESNNSLVTQGNAGPQ